MKKELKFVFDHPFSINYYENSLQYEVGEEYAKNDFKSRLLKDGYLIKDLVSRKAIIISCYAAKTTISFKERRKMQKEIDKMKPIRIFELDPTKSLSKKDY